MHCPSIVRNFRRYLPTEMPVCLFSSAAGDTPLLMCASNVVFLNLWQHLLVF